MYDQPSWSRTPRHRGEQRAQVDRDHAPSTEEDAGKLCTRVPDSDRKSRVDFNRSGVPLIEIVSEPTCARRTRRMPITRRSAPSWSTSASRRQHGGGPALRCERLATAKARKRSAPRPSSRTSTPSSSWSTLSSTKSGGRRRSRFGAAGEPGDPPLRPKQGRTYPMRSKEEAHDTVLPEPDLPPLEIDDAWIETVPAICPSCRPRAARASWRWSQGQERSGAESGRALGTTSSGGPCLGRSAGDANWIETEVLAR